MVATLQLTPEERTPFSYILALEADRLRHSTRENQEIAAGLASILDGVQAAADGPLEVDLASDEAYLVGVRNHADASELEEYWLDSRAARHQRDEQAPFPSDAVGSAISRFYPEVVSGPDQWHFNDVQPLFLEIGFKLDKAMTLNDPNNRGIYNKERAEIIRRTRAEQARRAAQRGRTYHLGLDVHAWRQAIRAEHVAEGEMAERTLEGKRILIAKLGGEYFASDGVCTHAPELGVIMGLVKGTASADPPCVTCPWHGAQFDLRTGQALRQPYSSDFAQKHFVKGRVLSMVDFRRTASPIRTYQTKVEDGYVWVNVV